MPGRVLVRDPNASGGGRVALTPRARVVDTFTAPYVEPPPQSSTAEDLADALSSLSPVAQNYANRYRRREADRIETETEEQMQEGARLFQQSRLDYAEAVRRGTIPAGANPHLVRGYRVASLQGRSQAWAQQLQQAWATSPVRNSNDPDEFQAFLADQTEAILSEFEGYSPSELEEGFQPSYNQAVAALQQQHTAFRVNDNEQRLQAASGEVMAGFLQQYIRQGVDPSSTAGQRALRETASFISAQGRSLRETGLSYRVANRLMTDAIIAQAEQAGRVDVLDAADSIRTGTGVLSGIPEHGSRLQAARQRIINDERARENAQRTRIEREARDLGDRLTGSLMQAALETGGERSEAWKAAEADLASMISNGLIRPEVLQRVQAFRDNAARGEVSVYEDPSDVAALQEILAESTTEDGYERIIDYANQRRLTSGTVRSLGQFYSRRKDNATVYGSRLYRDLEQDLFSTIAANDRTDPLGNQRRRVQATNAKWVFAGLVSEWAQENPEAAQDLSPGSPAHRAILGFYNETLGNPAFRVGADTVRTAGNLQQTTVEGTGPSIPPPGGTPELVPQQPARLQVPVVGGVPDLAPQGATALPQRPAGSGLPDFAGSGAGALPPRPLNPAVPGVVPGTVPPVNLPATQGLAQGTPPPVVLPPTQAVTATGAPPSRLTPERASELEYLILSADTVDNLLTLGRITRFWLRDDEWAVSPLRELLERRWNELYTEPPTDDLPASD